MKMNIQKRFAQATEKEHWEKDPSTAVFRRQRECCHG